MKPRKSKSSFDFKGNGEFMSYFETDKFEAIVNKYLEGRDENVNYIMIRIPNELVADVRSIIQKRKLAYTRKDGKELETEMDYIDFLISELSNKVISSREATAVRIPLWLVPRIMILKDNIKHNYFMVDRFRFYQKLEKLKGMKMGVKASKELEQLMNDVWAKEDVERFNRDQQALYDKKKDRRHKK